MCALGPYAFYAVASDRTSPILHLCAHLDPICLMWPSRFIYGTLTSRNYMRTSRPHLSKVALLFRWRLIYYRKSPSGGGGLLDPGPSVRLSVRLSVNNFYSALDLPYYWEESNETLHSERIFIVVVHLGIGFIEQRKMCL